MQAGAIKSNGLQLACFLVLGLGHCNKVSKMANELKSIMKKRLGKYVVLKHIQLDRLNPKCQQTKYADLIPNLPNIILAARLGDKFERHIKLQ